MKNIKIRKTVKGNGYFITVDENQELAVTAEELLELHRIVDVKRQDLIIEVSKMGGK